MNEISYKQTEAISNEYILALLVTIIVLGALLFYGLRFLKEKNFLGDFSNKKVKVKETTQLSTFSKAIVFEMGGNDYVLVESSRNIQLVPQSSVNLIANANTERLSGDSASKTKNDETTSIDNEDKSLDNQVGKDHA